MPVFCLRRLLVALLLLFSQAALADGWSRIYVFGDSLSDTGNLASLVGPLPPPYYANRISNGPVAVDTLAAGFGQTVAASLHLIGPAVGPNYAVAGARAGGDEPIDLAAQVSLFLANHGYQAPADALYVVMIGGNDVRDARDAADRATARRIVKRAVRRVAAAVAALRGVGARHFLVANVPDLGAIPETRMRAAATGDASLVRRTTRLSRLFNHRLARALRTLHRLPETDIVAFDLFAFLSALLANAEQYGFTNTTDPCFSSETYTFYPGCEDGARFPEYAFFDEIHPTSRVHGFIGMAMGEALAARGDHESRELARHHPAHRLRRTAWRAAHSP